MVTEYSLRYVHRMPRLDTPMPQRKPRLTRKRVTTGPLGKCIQRSISMTTRDKIRLVTECVVASVVTSIIFVSLVTIVVSLGAV